MTTLLWKDVLFEIDHVRKNLKKILSKDDKKQVHLSRFNLIFDIAQCPCFINTTKEDFIYSNCTCPDEKKLINFQTYKDQMIDKDAVILLSDNEKEHFDKILSSKYYLFDCKKNLKFLILKLYIKPYLRLRLSKYRLQNM